MVASPAHCRSVVDGAIVEHEVQSQGSRHAFVDLLEEAYEAAVGSLSSRRDRPLTELAGWMMEPRLSMATHRENWFSMDG